MDAGNSSFNGNESNSNRATEPEPEPAEHTRTGEQCPSGQSMYCMIPWYQKEQGTHIHARGPSVISHGWGAAREGGWRRGRRGIESTFGQGKELVAAEVQDMLELFRGSEGHPGSKRGYRRSYSGTKRGSEEAMKNNSGIIGSSPTWEREPVPALEITLVQSEIQ